MPDRALVWVGSTLETVRRFPASARRIVGHQLHRIQMGVEPLDWRPMPAVGIGVRELRVRAGTGQAFRVLYLASAPGAIYVLHAFEKQARRTSVPAPPRGMTMPTRTRRSTGNIFRDLGFDREEAEHLRLRSELMIRIDRIITERHLTQAAAARLLGVTQPRISDLVRGKIDLFSIDTLVDMLAHAGIRVTLTLRPQVA